MSQAGWPPTHQGSAGAMKCRECGGNVFSVADMEDQTPITCDLCGSLVGRWSDVRALTNIPEKEVLDENSADIFRETFHGVAELSLVSRE